jgi:hypothetical protein
MRRPFHLLLLLALPACQGPGPLTGSAPPPDSFNHDTARTYDVQTREFQAEPPFGAQSNRDQ